jgi:hypothetical protein
VRGASAGSTCERGFETRLRFFRVRKNEEKIQLGY